MGALGLPLPGTGERRSLPTLLMLSVSWTPTPRKLTDWSLMDGMEGLGLGEASGVPPREGVPCVFGGPPRHEPLLHTDQDSGHDGSS